MQPLKAALHLNRRKSLRNAKKRTFTYILSTNGYHRFRNLLHPIARRIRRYPMGANLCCDILPDFRRIQRSRRWIIQLHRRNYPRNGFHTKFYDDVFLPAKWKKTNADNYKDILTGLKHAAGAGALIYRNCMHFSLNLISLSPAHCIAGPRRVR